MFNHKHKLEKLALKAELNSIHSRIPSLIVTAGRQAREGREAAQKKIVFFSSQSYHDFLLIGTILCNHHIARVTGQIVSVTAYLIDNNVSILIYGILTSASGYPHMLAGESSILVQ